MSTRASLRVKVKWSKDSGVAAAVLVGQQHAVIPQDEIVQEAVEVDHGHVAEGVIAALSRAAGEGLVVIAPLVGPQKYRMLPEGEDHLPSSSLASVTWC